MNDKRAANAARVRTLSVGMAVAGVVGTGAFGGLAWAQDHRDTVGADSTNGSSTSADGSWNSGGSTTTWPQLSSGTGGSSHTRSSGS